MKRILIANIFGIGDVLFTTPLITNIKKAYNDVTIDYLCNARTQDVVECLPDIDKIFVYEKDYYRKLWTTSKIKWLQAFYVLGLGIRRRHYDIVFDFTLSREFGLFFYLIKIPKRIGFRYKKRSPFLTDGITITDGFANQHVVEYYLDLLKFINVPAIKKSMHLVPDEGSREWARDYLIKKRIANGAVLAAIVPGSGASWGKQSQRRRWSWDGFAKVANNLSKQGVMTIILGDMAERKLCQDVASRVEISSLIVENDLSLKNFIALLSKCTIIVCNDGGPLHIANALGIGTVSIFGPVDYRVYGPYPLLEKHKVITNQGLSCRPCYSRFRLPECTNLNRCLTDINPEYVTEKCLELLNEIIDRSLLKQ